MLVAKICPLSFIFNIRSQLMSWKFDSLVNSQWSVVIGHWSARDRDVIKVFAADEVWRHIKMCEEESLQDKYSDSQTEVTLVISITLLHRAKM